MPRAGKLFNSLLSSIRSGANGPLVLENRKAPSLPDLIRQSKPFRRSKLKPPTRERSRHGAHGRAVGRTEKWGG